VEAVPKTGSKDKDENLSSDNTADYVDVVIPTFLGNEIAQFRNDAIIYNGMKMNYTDIDSVSCKQIYRSINLIPYQQDFVFTYYSNTGTLQISFGTTMHLGIGSRKEAFGKLFTITKALIIPVVVGKLVHRMHANGETINIGGVYFNKVGYYTKSFLTNKENWVYWKDEVAEPQMASGTIVLYKSDGKQFKHFYGISVEIPNAIVIPDLVSAMYFLARNN